MFKYRRLSSIEWNFKQAAMLGLAVPASENRAVAAGVYR
jgi:hypothetical protein